MRSSPTFLHPLDTRSAQPYGEFTFPFRYSPHPLCLEAAARVQAKLKESSCHEGKMFGVLVVEGGFLAAYSGQLGGSYANPWFVPPIVDYLNPESYFQKEQTEIDGITERINLLERQPELLQLREKLKALLEQRDAAVREARLNYENGKKQRDEIRRQLAGGEFLDGMSEAQMIAQSQRQKADIRRARQQNVDEIAETKCLIDGLENKIDLLKNERKTRSEALQQWLFRQFVFLNARGERKGLVEIFGQYAGLASSAIPSGAGECCAPKLLNAAYSLGLKPIAMAEFWWGGSPKGLIRRQGNYYPACSRKCRPILSFMLEGLNVAPDPAQHYERLGGDVEVLWEDPWMAVIVKPTGWLSVPGKSSQPDIRQAVLQRWPDISGPAVVHRLDQDTSGLMLVAKTQISFSWLQKMFMRREIHKCYVALLEGAWQGTKKSGTIRLPLSPDYDDLPRQKVDSEQGLETVTLYEILCEDELFIPHEQPQGAGPLHCTRVKFYPLTGRTHQLRLHASSPEGLNLPIIGDRLYGNLSDRLYLHASTLDFVHPATGEQLHFEAPVPF